MIDFGKDEQYQEMKGRFVAFYEEKLRPLLEANNKLRRRYLVMFVILLLMALIVYPLLILAVFYFAKNNQDDSVVGGIIAVSGFVIMILNGPIYFFKKKAKSGGVMAEFAGFFGTFEYENGRYLPDSLLQNSQLFASYTTHSGDDYFCGMYKDVNITISEEHLRRITYSANHILSSKTVFRGICISLRMNKNFKGRTVVLKDKGLLNIFNQLQGLERVKLEDLHFEDIFEVYSDDQIEARYLMTSAFMERMLRLRDLFGGKSIQFSFKDNYLLLAIPNDQNLFETASLFRDNVNKKRMERVFDQFYTVFSVVDVLKLNIRTGL